MMNKFCMIVNYKAMELSAKLGCVYVRFKIKPVCVQDHDSNIVFVTWVTNQKGSKNQS